MQAEVGQPSAQEAIQLRPSALNSFLSLVEGFGGASVPQRSLLSNVPICSQAPWLTQPRSKEILLVQDAL